MSFCFSFTFVTLLWLFVYSHYESSIICITIDLSIWSIFRTHRKNQQHHRKMVYQLRRQVSDMYMNCVCIYVGIQSYIESLFHLFLSFFLFLFFFLQEFFFLVTLLKCCFQDCLRLTYFVGNCISFYIYICICIYDDYIHFFFTCLHHLYINILLLLQYVFDIVYQSFHSMLHMKFLYTCLTFYCSSSSKLAFLYSILFIYLFSFFPVFPFSPHFQIKMHWKPKIPRFLEGTIHLRQLLVASKTM